MKLTAPRTLGLLALLPALSLAQSTIDPSQPYAYSANTGWINTYADGTNGLTTYDAFCAGYAYSANIGWIHFGDGTPQNGYHYSNSTQTDYGVNIDTSGNLTGYAYSANAGWISFSWADSQNSNRPRIDLTTGAFSGYAYGANIGWILLGTSQLTTTSLQIVDTDTDTISDTWEYQTWGNLTHSDATTDTDGDGATDLAEYLAGTAADDPFSLLQIISYTPTSTQAATLTFLSQATRHYRIQWNTDLGTTWQDTTLGTFTPDAGTTTTKAINWETSSNTRFLRVIATPPLTP